MESIKYVDLIEICPVVIEIRGVENSELTVPVNNTLAIVCHTTVYLDSVSHEASNQNLTPTFWSLLGLV